MQEKRSVRFGKWLLKVIVSYAVFIAVGLLLSFVPAGRIGLSEEMFLNLRMFFMLFGPIYLTLIVKIILTFVAAAKRQEQGAAEKSRGILFAVTALLLFVNLSNARTVSDLTAGYGQGKGLRNLEKSNRYSLKGKRFLNVFLPVCLYMLILELLTLLVCIVIFAPLSRAASNAFICTIALTALLLFLVPLILSFISGYQGDKAEHEEKRARENQAAVQSDILVLETDPVRRKRYLRPPKLLVLLVCPGVCIVSGFVLYLTKNAQELLVVQLLRMPFLSLMAAAVFSFIPLLMYWANCSGTSLVQRVYLAQNQLYYAGYSGSMEERVEFTFALLQLESCRVGKRAIYIRGQFAKKTQDAYGTSQKGLFFKTLWVPRTFPVEQERVLLQFLQSQMLPKVPPNPVDMG